MAKQLSYEENIEKLENIIDRLENEKVSLADSLKLYKDGVGLVKQCNDMLDKVEKQIKVLEVNEEE